MSTVLESWFKTIVLIGSILVSLAIAWGKVDTRVSLAEQRLTIVERLQEQNRQENRDEHKQILDQVNRILQRVSR